MAHIPQYIGKGTFTSGTAALTVPVPTSYRNGDIFLLFVESANQAIATPAGWTELPNSPQSTGTAAAAGGVRLAVFYKVATGSEASVTVADTGDHTTAIIMNFRGVDPQLPIDWVAGSVSAATTAMVFPSLTTTQPNELIVLVAAMDTDAASTTTMGAVTNANLTGITELHDQTIAGGVGGGLAIASGVKVTAGATGTSTATGSTSVTHAYMTIGLRARADTLTYPRGQYKNDHVTPIPTGDFNGVANDGVVLLSDISPQNSLDETINYKVEAKTTGSAFNSVASVTNPTFITESTNQTYGMRGSAMIYDAKNDRYITFGGYDGTTRQNHIWEKRMSSPGQPWRRIVATGTAPTGRNLHAATYVRGTTSGAVDKAYMVIWGGFVAADTGDMYVLDVSTIGSEAWSTVTQTTPPSARSYITQHMAVTPVTGQASQNYIYFFGGFAGAARTNDLYRATFNVNTPTAVTWTTLKANGAGGNPPARDGALFDYKASTSKLYLYGGFNGTVGLNDFWEYDIAGNTWTQITPSGTAPTGTSLGAGGYDPVNNRFWFAAGWQNTVATVSNHVGYVANVGTSPAWVEVRAFDADNQAFAGQASVASAYDSKRNWLAIHGQQTIDSTERYSYIIDYNTTGYTNNFPVYGMSEADWMGARDAPASILDPNTGEFLVINGFAQMYDESTIVSGSHVSEVWSFNTVTDTWRYAVKGHKTMPFTEGSTAAYDTIRNRIIVFGGLSGGAETHNEVWSLTADIYGMYEWKKLDVSGTPPFSRWLTASAYDASFDRMLITFGGSGDTVAPTSTIWEINFTNTPEGQWVSRTAGGITPTATWGPGYADAQDQKRLYVFGGATNSTLVQVTGQLVYLDYSTLTPSWVSRSLGTARRTPAFGYDSVNQKLLTFGGWGGGGSVQALGVYDIAGNTWTATQPSTIQPDARRSPGSIFMNGKFRITHGRTDSSKWFENTWELTPNYTTQASSTWRNEFPRKFQPHYAYFDPNTTGDYHWQAWATEDGVDGLKSPYGFTQNYGYTSKGTSSTSIADSGGDKYILTKIVLTTTTTIDKLYALLSVNNWNYTSPSQARAVIHADPLDTNPIGDQLYASSYQRLSNLTPSWTEFQFPSTAVLNAGTYWVGVQGYYQGFGGVNAFYSTGGPANNVAIATSDVSFVPSYQSWNASIYVAGKNAETVADFKLGTPVNNAPTIAPNSPTDAATVGGTNLPIVFTGTDPEANDIEYEVDISTSSTFAPATAVAFNSISADYIANATGTTNVSLTVPSLTNGIVLVPLITPSTVTSVTLNGVAMTRAGAVTDPMNYWWVAAPTAGTYTLSVTRSSTGTASPTVAYYLSNVNQQSPIGVQSQMSDVTGSSLTKTITPSAKSMVIAFERHQGGLGSTVDGTLTPTPAGSGTAGFAWGGSTGNTGANRHWLDVANTSTAYGWNTTVATDQITLDVIEIKAYVPPTKKSLTDSGFLNTVNGGDTHPFTSGQAVSYTATYTPGTYYWRVRAIDPSGSNAYGSWSATRSFVVSSLQTLTKTHTTNSVKRKQFVPTHSTSSVKRKATTLSHTTSSNKKVGAITRIHTTDSIKRKASLASHTTSANKKTAGLTRTHTTDAFKATGVQTLTRSHTTDSLKRKQFTPSHSTSSAIRKASVLSHSTSAVKRTATLKTHTTDSLKRKATLATHTTSANKRLATLKAHTTSANKRVSGNQKTHTTNSAIRRANVLAHTTSANVRKALTVSHTADSYKTFPLVQTLVDNFNDNSYDTTKWVKEGDVAQTNEQNGRLEITHGNYAEYVTSASVGYYSLVGSSAVVQVLGIGNQSYISHEAVFGIRLDGNNVMWASINQNQITPWKNVGGTAATFGAPLAYNLSTHGWLRWRENAGTVYLDTSADGISWTNRFSTPNPFALTKIQPYLQTGAWQAEATSSFAYFDNFNSYMATFTQTHSTDTIKRKASTSAHSTDSLKRKATTASHSTSSNKRKAGILASHTTSSVIRKANTLTHTTSAIKRKATVVSHTTSAVKRKATLATHTTNSVLRKSSTLSHTTSAVKRTSSQLSHTTNAFKRSNYVLSHTTNAFKRRVGAANVKVLVVAGGGSGGGSTAGGGGAGGVLYDASHQIFSQTYNITVGDGAPSVDRRMPGLNGENSVFDNMTSIGGGGGGYTIDSVTGGPGQDGGSGGGGAIYGGAGAYPGGLGTPGQGNNGGNYGTNDFPGGGGGGAGAVGQDGGVSKSGDGGIGIVNPIAGSTIGENVSGTYYIAGGGGGGSQSNGGAGGNGGGGDGTSNSTVGFDALPNTGGGGGGGWQYAAGYGGAGGSGVVIISFPTNDLLSHSATGAYTVTTVGDDTIYTFTGDGTFSPETYGAIVKTHTTDAFKHTSHTIAHTTNALKRSVGTLTHSTSAVIRRSGTLSHSTNALKRKATLVSHTTSSNLKKAFTRTHTTSANKRTANNLVSHTTNALKRKANTLSHSTDSFKRTANVKTHTTNSLLRRQLVLTHSTNALKRKATLVSHTTSANKRRATVLSHTTNALKRSATLRSHTTDSFKRTGYVLSHSTNSFLRKSWILSHTTDTFKRTIFSKTHTTDSNKRRAYTLTHSTSAVKRTANTLSHSTNALKRTLSTRSHTTDSFLRRAINLSHTTSSALRKANTLSHTTSANKRRAYSSVHTTSANKRRFTTVFHTTSANRRKANTLAHTTNALKRRALVLSHSTDTVKRTLNVKSHTTDSFLRTSHELSHSTSLVKRTANALSHSTSSIIRKASPLSHSTDSFKRTANVLAHTTDSFLRRAISVSHSTDAFRRTGYQVTHSTSSNKRRAYSVVHSTSANKRKSGNVLSHSTNSAIRKANILSHSTDTVKRTANVLSHTTSSAIRKSTDLTHTTDSFLRRATTVSHSTDANRRKSNLLSHTTNANKRRATLKTHTTSANKRRTNLLRTHTTNAMLRKAFTKVHTTDANKKRSGYSVSHTTSIYTRSGFQLAHNTDTNKRRSGLTVSHTTDALKRISRTLAHTTSLVKRKATLRTHTTSALKRKAFIASHTTSANKRRLTIVSHTTSATTRSATVVFHHTDALKRRPGTVSHSTDTNRRSDYTLSHSTDSFLRSRLTLSHSTSANKRRGFIASHTTNANKRKAGIVSHQTSANIRRATEVAHSTDSLLHVSDTIEHSTDTLVRRSSTISHSTDSNKRTSDTVAHSTDTTIASANYALHQTDANLWSYRGKKKVIVNGTWLYGTPRMLVNGVWVDRNVYILTETGWVLTSQ